MKLNSNSKTVIVLGLPRSGTSLTAGILQILGVSMDGDEIPTTLNPKGCYEDRNFALLDKKIVMKAFNLKTYIDGLFWNKKPSDKDISLSGKYYRKNIIKLVKSKNKNDVWGWKFPLTVLTIENYLPYLVNPHFVVVSRNSYDVMNSSKKAWKYVAIKNDIDILIKINFYQERILKILKKYKNIPYIILPFEELANNPQSSAKKIAVFLNLRLSKKSHEKVRKLVIPRRKIVYHKKLAGINLKIRNSVFYPLYKEGFANLKKPYKLPIIFLKTIQNYYFEK